MNKIISFGIALLILIILVTPMNSATTVKALVEKQARAWENQDVSSLITDFAPDAVFQAGGFRFQGVKAIKKAAEDYFRSYTDTRVKIKRLIIDNNQGAVEWDWSDRHQTTGKPSAAEDAIIFKLRSDGKIIYWREYIEKKKVK